jgi:glyoxylase-like metal-dependent hydrolase (beta-lactamase superfamily II)
VSHGPLTADPITGASGPWFGGEVTPRSTCVLAPNASPMTLDGTNTWIVGEPGAASVVVVDPGPDDPIHREAIIDELRQRQVSVAKVLLTHGHPDHAEGAVPFASAVGAPVLALDPAHRLGDEGLAGGQVIDVEGLILRIVGTPGHTSDSLSFFIEADGSLLTGDTVLGRGTTVVMHPDGRVGDYLASLRHLRELAENDQGITAILPGHGPVLHEPRQVLRSYEEHRRQRLAAVAEALAIVEETESADVVLAIVERVYADVPREVWPAAALSVAAQVEFLREQR